MVGKLGNDGKLSNDTLQGRCSEKRTYKGNYETL